MEMETEMERERWRERWRERGRERGRERKRGKAVSTEGERRGTTATESSGAISRQYETCFNMSDGSMIDRVCTRQSSCSAIGGGESY